MLELLTMVLWNWYDENLLLRCKRIGILASEHWKGDYPKFNTPEKKVELNNFASQIEAECGIPEIGFTWRELPNTSKIFFNEQQQYKKTEQGTAGTCMVCFQSLFTTIEAVLRKVEKFNTDFPRWNLQNFNCFISNSCHKETYISTCKVYILGRNPWGMF